MNEAAYRGFALIANPYAKARWLRWSQGKWEAVAIVEISGIWFGIQARLTVHAHFPAYIRQTLQLQGTRREKKI